MLRSLPLVWLVASSSLASSGCARSAEEKQLDELREQMTQVRSGADKFDQRLASLEVKESDSAHAPTARSDAAPPSPTPPLRVVRLAPSEADNGEESVSPAEDPDAPAVRPSIRVVGAADARGGGKKGRAHDETVEETIPDEADASAAKATVPRPSALDPNAKRAYDDALALVMTKKYSAALDAFAGFLVRWPDHPYADNATYWRGECYFAQGDFARAAEQFEGTYLRFPMGNKAPDALLKLGMTEEKLGNHEKARDAYSKLGSEYPKSEAARKIPSEKR